MSFEQCRELEADDLETDSDRNEVKENDSDKWLNHSASGTFGDDVGVDVTDGMQRGNISQEEHAEIKRIANTQRQSQSREHEADVVEGIFNGRWRNSRSSSTHSNSNSELSPSVSDHTERTSSSGLSGILAPEANSKGEQTPEADAWGSIRMDGSVGYNSADPEDIVRVRQELVQGYNPDDQAQELQEHFERMNLQGAQNMPTRGAKNVPAGGAQKVPPEGAPRQRRRRSVDEEEEEQNREIQELLSRGIIDQDQARNMQQGREMQRRLNRATEQYSDGDGHRPPRFDSDGIPVNWSQDSAQLRRSRAPFILVQLHPGDPEYDQIRGEMDEAGLDIVEAVRLQNVHLLDRFKSEMEDTMRRRPKEFDLNMRYLYHGTTVNKKNICEEGLDQRLSRMGFFGKGIYFSDNPLKCVHYTNPESSGPDESYLLKCRVILGTQKCYPAGQYDTTLKREPEKENPAPGEWRFYDSVLGCPKDYNEFVVYENRRAMIEYIISFKVNSKGRSALRSWTASPTSYNMQHNRDDVPGPTNDEDHFERISQVREAIRKKRCAEKGILYREPDESRRQQDKEMWLRLQRLHMPSNNDAQVPVEKASSHPESHMRHVASNPTLPDNDDELGANRTQLPHSESYAFGDQQSFSTTTTDAVGQVMSMLISNFLEVTSCDNIETAKYYLERNQMDVNKALLDYYDNIP